jgi:predicted Fe-Mo cluster-binding NifX family protein
MTSAYKIAVASEGECVDSPISDKAARSPYYLLFALTGEFIAAVANPCAEAAGPAAPAAARYLAEQGVGLLVAAEFGHKLLSELDSLGIRHITMSGEADGAVAGIGAK